MTTENPVIPIYRHCVVRRVVERTALPLQRGVDQDWPEAAEWVAWVNDPATLPADIRTVMSARNIRTHIDSLRRHRRGECTCGPPLQAGRLTSEDPPR